MTHKNFQSRRNDFLQQGRRKGKEEKNISTRPTFLICYVSSQRAAKKRAAEFYFLYLRFSIKHFLFHFIFRSFSKKYLVEMLSASAPVSRYFIVYTVASFSSYMIVIGAALSIKRRYFEMTKIFHIFYFVGKTTARFVAPEIFTFPLQRFMINGAVIWCSFSPLS